MSDTVDCPYCNAENEMHPDYYMDGTTFDHECEGCGKEFQVDVDFTPHYYASKIEKGESGNV